jgi:hypothetical protein
MAQSPKSFCGAFFKKRPLVLRALRHDFVGDVAGDGVVVVELHRERRAAFGHAAEVADVAEHFLQRHMGADDDGGA